ncbi:hypothetical protein PpBr36_07174 [Pyricularia pennisetigena]|uniref:hypothetical protein n=1 Tax=Pyricularia pennisetigena TaxID=1578925 RepID=UPI00114E20AE|nr:hypothetical protein PpBr36_07174 [Pyricularia pennisetigena]TLS25358.1 hypothetical protein PpBr36_07174 [Pyricularia pennisetigena]
MASSSQNVLLSPAELAYLHDSLSLTPPIRPDGRTATQFRPLTAETGILPGTNGSARICFADGTEAIVGVKAEVEKTRLAYNHEEEEAAKLAAAAAAAAANDDEDGAEQQQGQRAGRSEWVELSVEMPGLRDDDANTIFLTEMLSEALLADGEFAKKLWINSRFHWKLYLDVILISPPLSYPLPLLSLTTHLALLATRLPRLKSEGDEDPLFDDDWDVSPFLYSREKTAESAATSRPPITLLVTAVGDNIIFDPSKEELAVADVAIAISITEAASTTANSPDDMEVDSGAVKPSSIGARNLRLLSIRVIDPPSRLTPSGAADDTVVDTAATNTIAAPTLAPQKQTEARNTDTEAVEGVWKPPRGGTKLAVMNAIVQKVLEKGGVADEVLDALKSVELS